MPLAGFFCPGDALCNPIAQTYSYLCTRKGTGVVPRSGNNKITRVSHTPQEARIHCFFAKSLPRWSLYLYGFSKSLMIVNPLCRPACQLHLYKPVHAVLSYWFFKKTEVFVQIQLEFWDAAYARYQKEQHQHRAWDAFFFTMPQPPIILLMRKRLHKETKSRERESLSHKSLDNSSVLSNFAFITVSCIKLIFSMLALTKIQLFLRETALFYCLFWGYGKL